MQPTPPLQPSRWWARHGDQGCIPRQASPLARIQARQRPAPQHPARPVAARQFEPVPGERRHPDRADDDSIPAAIGEGGRDTAPVAGRDGTAAEDGYPGPNRQQAVGVVHQRGAVRCWNRFDLAVAGLKTKAAARTGMTA
jgi:hypothetical protein